MEKKRSSEEGTDHMLVSIFSLKKHLKKSNRYSLAVSPDGPKQWGASPPEGQWHLSIKLPPIRALGAAIYSADIKEGAKLQEPFPQTPGEILSRAVLARAGPLRPSDQSRPCQSWGSERNGRPPSSLLPFPSPPSFSSVRGTGYHKNIVQTREKNHICRPISHGECSRANGGGDCDWSPSLFQSMT